MTIDRSSGGSSDGFVDNLTLSVVPAPGACGGSKRFSSSDPAYTLGFGGTLTEQIDRANQPPPPFDPDNWNEVHRKNENDQCVFRCDCTGVPPELCEQYLSDDPLGECFISASEHLRDADEVTLDNCGSAFYRSTFNLPPNAARASLSGETNVDDQAVLYLNGRQVSGTMTNPDCNPDSNNGELDPCYGEQDWFQEDDVFDDQGRRVLNWPSKDPFATNNPDDFVPGLNELIFAVVGDASFFEPTGLEFEGTVQYDLDVSCEALTRFTAKCKPTGDTYAVRSKANTTMPESHELTLQLDAQDCKTATVRSNGIAKAKLTRLPEGDYELCVPSCPETCQRARCQPQRNQQPTAVGPLADRTVRRARRPGCAGSARPAGIASMI